MRRWGIVFGYATVVVVWAVVVLVVVETPRESWSMIMRWTAPGCFRSGTSNGVDLGNVPLVVGNVPLVVRGRARMLWEIVGDLVPGSTIVDEGVALRANAGIAVERAQPD